MGLFGTSGIRGPAATLFTNQFSFDIGRTFAKFLALHKQNGPIAVGMDPRASSPRIKENFIKGLNFEGREVFDEGISPIPAINFILIAKNFSGSAMVSGSHIKADLNGIKFFAFKEEISKENESEIEEIYKNLKGRQKVSLSRFEVQADTQANELYKDMLVKLAKTAYPSWKVVVDPGNGAQSLVLPEVFERSDIKTTIVNANPEASEFFARDTENEGEFKKLEEKVVQEKADFGVAWDADGDRCVFVDEKGNYIPGDYTGALIARDSPGDTVVTPVNTSSVVEHIGKKVVRTKVGSPYVVAKMKESGARFGFEANGGGISAEIMYSRDGGSTAIKVLNILARKKKSLSSLIGELPKFYLYRTKVEYKWELKEKIISEAKKQFKGKMVDELDGLKIWLDDKTWILFRSSANAPEFRVFAESTTRERAQTLGKKGIGFVKEVVKKS